MAVAGLADSLEGLIRDEARPLLAADLAVSGRLPPPEQLPELLATFPDTQSVLVRETLTLVAAPTLEGMEPGPSRLVELKAVSAGYPFYGELRTEPNAPISDLLTSTVALAAPELLTALQLEIGDALRIGSATFRVGGSILSEPDRLGGSFTRGPRVLLSQKGLDRANLIQRGSRVTYRTLIKMGESAPAEQIEGMAEVLRQELDRGAYRVETYAEAQPALRQGLRRTERFLGLVALLSLLAGGIGIAQAARSWVAGRMQAIAVFKCLGLRPLEVLVLFLAQAAIVGLAGSLCGVALGFLVLAGVPLVLGDLIPQGAVQVWQPLAMLKGLGLGLGVALLFTLPPLLATLRVRPARVLRQDAEPLPVSRWNQAILILILATGVTLLAIAQAGSFQSGLFFTLGLTVVTGLLAVAALGTRRFAGSLLRKLLANQDRGGAGRAALRYGVGAAARPGSDTLGAIIGLGLGVTMVLSMALVEERLSDRLRSDLPKAAPTLFLINIQPPQWAGVREMMLAAGAENIDSVPVVTARLSAIDGQSTNDLAEQLGSEAEAVSDEENTEDRRWALTREQQLTYLETLPDDNKISEGSLWNDPARAEISIEQSYAKDLGIELGSRLTFDIQGVPLDMWVTSLRTVDWESFRINFFLVAEPGFLEEAPQQRLAAARMPRGGEQALQDRLVATYPNITLFNLAEILAKIGAVLRRVALGVRLLGAFTILAGTLVLAGAVSANSSRRSREVALLKTLGLTRQGVMGAFAIEQALIGVVAGVIGSLGGALIAWLALTRGFELPWDPPPTLIAISFLGAILLSVVAGLLASTRALLARPRTVLRQNQN